MALRLGKIFDRNFNIRFPFLDGNYDVGIFFNKYSSFLLFSVDGDFSTISRDRQNIKINMYKSLVLSKFCESFLILHNYKNENLDIINQFESIKAEYFHDINLSINESISLSKYEVDNKVLYDTLNVYGFLLSSYINEFIFIIAERQFIDKKINRKIVRTCGLQIATTSSLDLINRYHQEDVGKGKMASLLQIPSGDTIVMEEQ
jgi:hypothetical protein